RFFPYTTLFRSHADADHRVVDAIRGRGELEEDARDLAPVELDVVGPLDPRRRAERPKRLRQSDRRDRHELGCASGGKVGPEDHREEEVLAGRAEPRPPAPALAPRLAVGDHRLAVQGAHAGEALRLLVGGIEHLVAVDRPQLALLCFSSREMSTARAWWVIAPALTKSAPVRASRGRRSRVTPPETSVRARPPTRRTASAIASSLMLSRRITSAPAAAARSASSGVVTSISILVSEGARARARAIASSIEPTAARWLSLMSTPS